MDEAERYLQANTGFCIFPVMDPSTGKAKHVCGAMTFKKDGVYQRFCEKHEKEIRERAAVKRNGKKRFLLLGGVKNN